MFSLYSSAGMKLSRLESAELVSSDLLQEKQVILDKYKYALRFIGVDFSNEVVQEALLFNHYGFEEALQATIAYWHWLSQQQQLFHGNATLIKALGERWSARYWKDEYLDKPEFRHPRDIFWDEAAQHLGRSLRNQAIVDIVEDDDEELHIVFCTGRSSPLINVKYKGWHWLKDNAQEQIEEKQRLNKLLHSRR